MKTWTVALGAFALLAAFAARAADAPAKESAPPSVAILTYGAGAKDGKPLRPVCFAAGFLTVVDRDSSVRVSRQFEPLRMADPKILAHPMVILSGEGAFTLGREEKAQLVDFVKKGGFILASPGCSSGAWAESFKKTVAELWGKDALKPLAKDHAVFHAFYDIEALVPRQPGTQAQLFGMESGGHLALAYCPVGLNDTPSAGNGCCCCGANEVRNAREMNANLLIHALTH